MDLLSRDQQYIMNTYRRLPIVVKKAKGSYLIDESNQAYLDFFAGIAVNSLGHSHQVIQKAMKKQMRQFLHLSNYFSTESVVELAKKLTHLSGLDQVFFTNSGTEATEAAMKLARKATRQLNPEKLEFIALKDSFHGRTLGALSLTGQPKYQESFRPLIPLVRHIERNNLDQLKQAVNDKTSAIFLEVIQGESGVQVLSEDFLQTIMDLQAQYHFLIVADEVQSGLYRTGIPFSYQRTPLKPDMVTVAKSLGGGLPIGALIATSEVSSAFTYGDHGSTFGGNPFVAALGNALLGELSSATFQTHLQMQCHKLLQGLKEIAKLYPHVITQIRGEGMMLGLEVGTYAPLIQKAAFNKKLLLNVTNQTVIRLLPPLTINQKELTEFFTKFKQSIDEVCLQ